MSNSPSATSADPASKKPKLLDQFRDALRTRHDSLRAEQSGANGGRETAAPNRCFGLPNVPLHCRGVPQADPPWCPSHRLRSLWGRARVGQRTRGGLLVPPISLVRRCREPQIG